MSPSGPADTGTGAVDRSGPAPVAGTAARRAARSTDPNRPGGTSPGERGSAARRRQEAATRRQLDPDALAALEEERDFLLASLADLEREHAAGDVDDTDYAELKDDYTARSAAVLRAIEDRHELARQVRAPRSWGRTTLVIALVALFAVLGGVLLARAAGNRPPDGTFTGDLRLSSRDALLRAQGYTGQATQALQAGDTDAALENYRLAIETYQDVLEMSPGNVEALTYQGWVFHTVALSSQGQAAADLDAQALARLDEAIAADPDYPDARVFRAIMHERAGRLDAARTDLDALDPGSVPAYMADMVEGLRARVTAATNAAPTP